MLAEYLTADLQRIARCANEKLRLRRQAGMHDRAREARIVADARAAAVRRVESTLRQLRTERQKDSGRRRRRNTNGGPFNTCGHARYRVDAPTTADNTTAASGADSPECGEQVRPVVYPDMRTDEQALSGEPAGSAEPAPQASAIEPADAEGSTALHASDHATDVFENLAATEQEGRVDDEPSTEMPATGPLQAANDEAGAASDPEQPVDESTIVLRKTEDH